MNKYEVIEKLRADMEDRLIELRDARMSVIGPFGHGLHVKEPDGTPSKVMRITTAQAIEIFINHLEEIGLLNFGIE